MCNNVWRDTITRMTNIVTRSGIFLLTLNIKENINMAFKNQSGIKINYAVK